MVKTDVVKTVETVDPVGMEVIDADSEVLDVIESDTDVVGVTEADPETVGVIDDPETVEVGATSEVETTEDEAVPLD
jgi:hypothetical protein